MARRKRAASPAPVEDVEEEIEGVDADIEGDLRGSKRLRFNEPLTWRAGKAIPVSELLRRLRTLYEELQPMEQLDEEEQDARRSLAPKAQELANSMLLGHKDKGIRAFAMLGIVEMFRILAPHAPYTTTQLKEIFTLFVTTIVPALAIPSDSYNAQHHSILESLGVWQSIVLISDIPGSEQLITSLFSNCFDVVSGTIRGSGSDQVSKNVEFHMSQMLSTLVEESGTLPSSVVEVVLAQFLRADLSTLASSSKKTEQPPTTRELSSAYTMAQYTCNTCADKMARYIGHYFNAVLIDASETSTVSKTNKAKSKRKVHDSSDDEDEDESGLLTPPSEDDLHEAEKAHRLLRELWRSCPDVIRNVIPQVEAQVTGENVNMRVMAVQTIGDMVAGIGAAGWPPAVPLDPSAYPSQSSESYSPPLQDLGILLTPNAPHAFASVYPSAYQVFIDRHRDKAPAVRSVWVAEAAQIVLTSGGGKGLETEQESNLLRHIADMLVDQDEKVRLSAVQSIARFDFPSIIQKIGSNGSVSDSGSILANLADRAVDPKSLVHTSALELLGRIWGVASGAIAEGNSVVRNIVGELPSHIFEARYKNIGSINAVVPQVLNESLLPIGYPPFKARVSTNGSQRPEDDENVLHPDRVRVERLLILLRDLGERAQRVFFQLQIQTVQRAAYLDKILEHCDVSNKAREGDSAESTKQIARLIDMLVRDIPDPKFAAEQLGKFFAHQDRRNFALTRFCCSPESDYKRVVNALKELRKRLEQAPSDIAATGDTVILFLRSASLLIYNKSHVPAIMDFARTDQQGLGHAANEILKEIATRSPTIFKAHVKELCETLKQQAPTATSANDISAVDSLKACAGFSRRFPKEMLADRDFYKAMTKMAMHGVPPAAAKHAVTVIVTSADKKDMYINDIMQYCIGGFRLGAVSYVSRLAAMTQLRLLANAETDSYEETITQIVADKILAQPPATTDASENEWDETVNDDLTARILALKLLVNGFRGKAIRAEADKSTTSLEAASLPIFKLLNTLIDQAGEISQDAEVSTPTHYKSRLRLAAANFLLKLCCIRSCDALFLPADFNRLVKIAQDPVEQVRTGFNSTLKKYLGQGKLRARFYGLVFIYAFEPIKSVKESTATWLRARAATYAQRQEGILEGVFPRFLSLLAHHDDFGTDADDLVDSVEYIMFYLKNVATETNLPHIYKFAQAMKAMGIQDRIDPSKSENLYVLSDLSEAIIRQYQEIRGWTLSVLPGKPVLPQGLFSRIHSTALAQEISEKRFLPEEIVDKLEDLVKASVKSKKRKAEGASSQPAKKPRQSLPSTSKTTPSRKPQKSAKSSKAKKTPQDAVPDSERRKSSRASRARNYAENEDSEDDDEMEQWQAASDVESEVQEDEDDRESSTPPTSQPARAAEPKAVRPQTTRALASRAVTHGRATRQQKQAVPTSADNDSEALSDAQSDMEM
jgi:sister-chromatid-cohesion protein PDS5